MSVDVSTPQEAALPHASVVGPIAVEAVGSWVTRIRLGAPVDMASGPDREGRDLAHRTLEEVHEYLAGERTHFDLPLDLAHATPFRRSVLEALYEIPYGSLISYGDLAGVVGTRSARAVGQAVGWNPFPIVIPCHRVVAGHGGLGGYSGGLERKQALLALEGGRAGALG